MAGLEVTTVAAVDPIASESSEYVDPDWIIVLPRRKKRKSHPRNLPPQQEDQTPWVPPDTQIDCAKESKLLDIMQTCLKKLEASKLYDLFLNQIEDPEVSTCFTRVLGSHPKMNMVIYGIGSIESYEPPRLQLSLAILLKRRFEWIGDVEVFDPILSATETKVLEALGCSVMSMNEQGRREALNPILFFMPHCEAVLYHNLLETNWDVNKLKNMALFGNSFESYEHHASVVNDYIASAYTGRILAARSFVKEFRIPTGADDHCKAFHESSWHFFSPDSEKGLPIV